MKIEFICADETIVETFPPIPAAHMIPEWYKKLSLYVDAHKLNAKELCMHNTDTQRMTIRGCTPVQDYLISGYIIRAHADIAITPEEVNGEHGWWYASRHTECEPHPYAQCPVHMGKGTNVYFKIHSPWMIKTPKGYSCMFYQPYYNLEDKFQLFPAVVDTDGYNGNPVFFPGIILTNESFIIPAGTPLMYVFPFKREPWEAQVSVKPELKINPITLFLERGYKKLFHKKKVFK